MLHEPLSAYRAPRDRAALVDVPDGQFLQLDGEGGPSEPGFQDAIHALYEIAHGIHFALRSRGVKERIHPLEALWSWDGGARHAWRWTLMIRVPDATTPDLLARCAAEARERRANARLAEVRLQPFHEGRAMQILHVGPYRTEASTLRRLHAQIREAGLVPEGKHHEVYLGDPRRAKPENLRTLLRQPVKQG